MAFLEEHNTLEVFQSCFKTLHSSESALLRVFNDIFLATDSGDCVVLGFVMVFGGTSGTPPVDLGWIGPVY